MASHPSNNIAANIDALFVTPTVAAEYQTSVAAITVAAKTLAQAIAENAPECADCSKSLQSVRDALDRAVSAIVNAPAVVDQTPWLP